MTHVRSLSVLAVTFLLGTALISFAEAQDRRGGSMTRGSLLGLLGNEAVQQELQLDEEQIAKVKTIGEDLRSEMGKQFDELRDIEDRDKRRAKMAELSEQFDEKVRQRAGEILPREKMIRLYQIRLQVRGAIFGLNHPFVAGRLKLTDEQTSKAAELEEATQKEIYALYTGMRDLTAEQRRELYQKIVKIRDDANQKAIELLTAEQKEAYEKLQGDKFEL